MSKLSDKIVHDPYLPPLKLSRSTELLGAIDELCDALGKLDQVDVGVVCIALVNAGGPTGWPERFDPVWNALREVLEQAAQTQVPK